MQSDKNPGQEVGWSLNVAFNEAVRPMGLSSVPPTGYHQWQILKAVLHAATDKASPRLVLHKKVIATQTGVEGGVGMEQKNAIWLSFLDPTFDARATARGRTPDEIAREKALDEAKMKSVLVSMGIPVEDVKGYAGPLGPATFVGKTLVAFFETAYSNKDEDKRYGPYWTYVPDDRAADAIAGKVPKPKLYNEDRRTSQTGRANVGGTSVSGAPGASPILGAPSGSPALGAGASLGAPGGAPALGAQPAAGAQAAAVLGGLGGIAN